MQLYYDAIVVGAGFAGIRSVQRLRNDGFSVRGIERSSSLGGAWVTNGYPGARCDSPVPFYQIMDENLAGDWHWSERFPKRPEIIEYFNYVDSKLNISKDYDFEVEVTKAEFDATTTMWQVSVSDGRLLLVKWLILGVGFSSKPYMPSIEGLQQLEGQGFEGQIYHSGAWPQSGVDVKGKRVAVVGTGTSSCQIVREIAPSVKSLTVYQRNPAVAFPLSPKGHESPDDPIPLVGKESFFTAKSLSTFTGLEHAFLNPAAVPGDSPVRHAYYEYLYEKGEWNILFSNFKDVWHDKRVNDDLYSFWAKQTRQKVEDAAKRDILIPAIAKYPIGTKRACVIDNYYETFNLPHVELVDVNQNPLREVTKTGIQSGEVHRDFDIIILATGYHSLAGGILALNITGRNGLKLEDAWANSSISYLGMTVPGFPNMFYLNGPGAPNARANAPTVIEHQLNWIVATLHYLRKTQIKMLEPTDVAAREWREEISKQWNATLYPLTISMQTRNHACAAAEPTWAHGVHEYGARLELCLPPALQGFITQKRRDLCKSVLCVPLTEKACVGC
ncbi:FAD/NAD(P)-binding domain-containing protein [Penicillium canescens]|nr:FAD/NAD(P)-binding domain-containing protein [Penicillium canescens]